MIQGKAARFRLIDRDVRRWLKDSALDEFDRAGLLGEMVLAVVKGMERPDDLANYGASAGSENLDYDVRVLRDASTRSWDVLVMHRVAPLATDWKPATFEPHFVARGFETFDDEISLVGKVIFRPLTKMNEGSKNGDS